MDVLPKFDSDGGPIEARPFVPVTPAGLYAGNKRLTSIGYQQVSVDMATLLIPPPGTLLAMVKVEGADVRYLDTGDMPTASYGMPLMVGETLEYDATMTHLRVIGQAPGAVCNITFYGEATDA